PALQPGEELIITLVRPVNLGEPCVLDAPPPPLLKLDEIHVSLDEAQSPHHQANIQWLHDVDGVEGYVPVKEVATLCHLGLSLSALCQIRTPGDLQKQTRQRRTAKKNMVSSESKFELIKFAKTEEKDKSFT